MNHKPKTQRLWEACTSIAKTTTQLILLAGNVLPGLLIYAIQLCLGTVIALLSVRIISAPAHEALLYALAILTLTGGMIGIIFANNFSEKSPDRGEGQ